jgi:hypothetical protein
LFRLLDDPGCYRIKISFAPDGAGQSVSDCGIFHHSTKQLALERVDPNVVVRNPCRVDHAPHDNTSAGELVSGNAVPPNQASYGPRSELPHGAQKPGEFGAAISRSSEARMVRLTRLRHRRIAQVNSAVVNHVW